jgi:hypothetical protein
MIGAFNDDFVRSNTVHSIIETDPLFGKVTLDDQSRILVRYDPDLPIGSIIHRSFVPESINLRWGKRLVSGTKRTESTAYLGYLNQEIGRSFSSLLGDDYPSAKNRISSKFRHAPL